jgi:exonuclease VII small subunit
VSEEESRPTEDSLQQAESLLERLERTRQELESTQDPDRAIEILSELAEIAKEVEAALAQAKKEAG